MTPLKQLPACPNCLHSYREIRGYSSVEVGQCENCGQVMCAYCCESAFWSGYICPTCKSRKVPPIGRIKDPLGIPTLQEELSDGTAFKSHLSPRSLRVLAVVGIAGCWLIGFPTRFNLITTIAGLVVFTFARRISRQ